MSPFKSRNAYRQEVKRRVALLLPDVEHYATTSPAKCPPALRPGMAPGEWVATAPAVRGSLLRQALREIITNELGPMPAPAVGDDPPRSTQPAHAPAPDLTEPEPAPITTRYFVGCSECGEPVGVDSPRARVVFCSASCAEARK